MGKTRKLFFSLDKAVKYLAPQTSIRDSYVSGNGGSMFFNSFNMDVFKSWEGTLLLDKRAVSSMIKPSLINTRWDSGEVQAVLDLYLLDCLARGVGFAYSLI